MREPLNRGPLKISLYGVSLTKTRLAKGAAVASADWLTSGWFVRMTCGQSHVRTIVSILRIIVAVNTNDNTNVIYL